VSGPSVVVECEGLAHPEGPAVLSDGRLVFVESFRGQVSQWGPGEDVHPFSLCGGTPNACAIGTDGVYVTQMGSTEVPIRRTGRIGPSIQKVDWEGNVRAVVTQVGGQPLRAPNDLCFGSRGTLCFTDPGPFSLTDPADGYIFSVFEDGSCDFALNVGPVFPNGIAALSDDSVVWVESYTRRVMRRASDGSVDEIAILGEGHMPDGFKVGVDEALYIATISSGGIDVVGLDGTVRAFIDTGGEPLESLRCRRRPGPIHRSGIPNGERRPTPPRRGRGRGHAAVHRKYRRGIF
jgi:gluconolactonase